MRPSITLYRAYLGDGSAWGDLSPNRWTAAASGLDLLEQTHATSAADGEPLEQPVLHMAQLTICPATPAALVAVLGWEPDAESLERAAELLRHAEGA